MLNAELLLLIDDCQTQVLETNIALYEPMCSNHDVQCASRQTFNSAPLLLRGFESRQGVDRHRIRSQPIPERLSVLLR